MEEDDYFPNPDEEFEMMYADELEMMNEMDDDLDDRTLVQKPAPPTVRRSLNFCGSPTSEDKGNSKSASVLASTQNNLDDLPISSTAPDNSSSSRKRTIDDIFGDIDDIELEEASEKHGQPLKRSCKQLSVDPSFFLDEDLGFDSAQDKELELIDRINALRRKAFLEFNEGRSAASPANLKLKESNTLTKGVPKWPFVSVTSELGERVYVRIRSDEYIEEEVEKVSHKGDSCGLLRGRFSALKNEALSILEKKQQLEIEANAADIAALIPSEDGSRNTQVDTDNLWVVKYKPSGYAELLSEESVNRTLLHWLKLWDKVVFNRERKPQIKPKEDKKENRFQKKPFGQVMTDELDEQGRPQYKMVLLCGPPGLGKTTLAHMVAKLAGYNVVEVNASDDRSPEAFYTQLQAATQMKAVMGKDPKPNCLVMDEIDGAPAPSIETLIKFVLGKDVGKGRGKKKGSAAGILKRPVICICNDAYVPALRSLRQHAFVLHFPPTGSERLASRLMTIARKQRIKTDMGAMLALCEKTQNDIRSCLSLLHYFKSQSKPVRLSDVHQSNVGLKDVQKGLFSVWQEIFQIQRSKGGFTQAANDASRTSNVDNRTPDVKKGDSAIAYRIQRVLRTVQSHGDYNRLIQGVFENYLHMRLRDSSLNGLVKGLDWFSTTDLINTEIMTSQNYILMPYMAYAFPVWHILFGGLAWPKINYPNTAYEVSVKQGHTKQILAEMVKGMSPSVRVNCNESQLVSEILPLLLEILVPNFRPVSLQLYSLHEKKELSNLISVMIDYNLTYVQERTPEGTYVCNMDPNIEEVVYFGGSKPSRQLTYGTKQLVAREIDMEKMRRFELLSVSGQKNETLAPGKAQDKTQVPNNSDSDNTSEKVSPTVPNHLQKLKAKPVIKDMQTKDFFGRIVEIPLTPSTVKARSEAELKGDIWFHFKEGFNNAVRKTIRISDLL
ncbi:chromosome transmission fidelity protein 18 homolog [Frankliniella occidentalis]|uniref:Chromosome transmission fidelity protein 18 homolog n=1 Tax=Frankliniella occidentalis TaxID=133901 RepID=A0A6J1TM60_FRAOC|nr:chromosome transmission fidelity protein 18 homolog [Frankliniella occidentalis]